MYYSPTCLFLLIGQMTDRILTHHHMNDVEGEDINGEQGERQGEHVEESVVPLAHTVAYPWTVVIKTICEKEKKVTIKYVKYIVGCTHNFLSNRNF